MNKNSLISACKTAREWSRDGHVAYVDEDGGVWTDRDYDAGIVNDAEVIIEYRDGRLWTGLGIPR